MVKTDVIIEIPKNSRVKYEVDKKTGLLRVDRYVALPYPENYGYVPNTLAEDNDPLDVFLISEQSIAPGAIVNATIIGMIPMIDGKEHDHKLLAIFSPEGELDYKDVRIQVIRNFLTTYKEGVTLKPNESGVLAEEYLKFCQERYLDKLSYKNATLNNTGILSLEDE